MLSAIRCKACKALNVRGSTHCARCGSRQGMTAPHKLLLGFGAAVIAVLFFVASRPPTDAEIEYRPVAPIAGDSQGVLPSAPAAVDEAGAAPAAERPPTGDPIKQASAPRGGR